MSEQELRDQLDREIRDEEVSVDFWRRQLDLRADSPLVNTVKEVADAHAAQLQELYAARRIFEK